MLTGAARISRRRGHPERGPAPEFPFSVKGAQVKPIGSSLTRVSAVLAVLILCSFLAGCATTGIGRLPGPDVPLGPADPPPHLVPGK